MRLRIALPFLGLLLAVELAGCGKTITVDDDGGHDGSLPPDGTPPFDGGMCGFEPVTREVRVSELRDVDLLFMIDDSGSMAEEQASLAAEIPRLVRVLASGENPSTGETFEPVRSLRVGVVSSDLGSGPNGACATTFGDDGVLQRRGSERDARCMSFYPTWLDFASGTDDPDTFALDVTCVADAIGTDGCGYEQPLEAVLKALTPSTSGLTFHGGTSGHGDGANDGFLREDALLAVVHLTDEDDCSTSDIDLFNPESDRYTDLDLNLRCHEYPEALHPIERYVQNMLERKRAPEQLVYATISGVPLDLVPDPDFALGPQVEAMLDDSRMQERVDPADSTRLLPSCDVIGRGRAYPPRRMVRVASALEDEGAGGVVQSICQSDFSGALNAIIAKLVRPLACEGIPLTPPRESSGEVACDLYELFDPALAIDCSAVPGRSDAGVDSATGRRRCQVNQVLQEGTTTPPATPAGWYFGVGPDCSDQSRLYYTEGAEPRLGSIMRLVCPVEPSSSDWVGVGTACTSDDRCAELPDLFDRTFPRGLVCAEGTCQPACTGDLDCPSGAPCVDGLCSPTC